MCDIGKKEKRGQTTFIEGGILLLQFICGLSPISPSGCSLFDKSGGSDFSHFVVVDGVTTKTVFLLLLFVILMVRSISVLLLPLREISRVRLLFLGVLWNEIKY